MKSPDQKKGGRLSASKTTQAPTTGDKSQVSPTPRKSERMPAAKKPSERMHEVRLDDENDFRWRDPSIDLREPPQPVVAVAIEQPRCGIRGCERPVEFRISVLLYPKNPVVSGPAYVDRGVRAMIGYACRKDRGRWTAASFLGSPAWQGTANAERFRAEFGGDPDPALAQLEIVRL